jgi:2-polyprenyl-6-methoxyphenol hydroxylase-like FAD-dependent oxidoreductase
VGCFETFLKIYASMLTNTTFSLVFRGEAVNHGSLDAMLLCDVLTKHARGKIDINEGVEKYEAELRGRRIVATPLSRQAAIDAHLLGGFPPGSPLVTRRAGPEIACTVIEA